MAIRRFHSKSRFGCSACKTRRVKCDENKPTCNNCIRRGTECIFPDGGPPLPTPSPSTSASASASAASPKDEPSYDALDMLLMHRFSTVTALGMSTSMEATTVWQTIIPVEAQVQPLLMHGILALAGLDLARFPSEAAAAYRTRALHHQQRGLNMFQEMLLQEPLQMHAIFPFSIMVIIITLASGQEGKEWSVDSIVDMFALYRGPRALAKRNWDTIKHTHLQAILSPGTKPTPPPFPQSLRNTVDGLDRVCDDDVAREALSMLARDIESAKCTQDLRAVGRWPAMVSDAFFARLKTGQPEAVALLSYYSLVLHGFRHVWWVGDWDQILLAAVDQALSGKDKMRLRWSMHDMKNELMKMRDEDEPASSTPEE